MVANQDNCILIDFEKHDTKKELDINYEYQISDISAIRIDNEDRMVYFVANKHNGIFGLYVLLVDADDHYKDEIGNEMIINWQKKLLIDDVSIDVLRDPINCHKEIVISYKTSEINLYTILVLDLHHSSEQPIMYRHESF